MTQLVEHQAPERAPKLPAQHRKSHRGGRSHLGRMGPRSSPAIDGRRNQHGKASAHACHYVAVSASKSQAAHKIESSVNNSGDVATTCRPAFRHCPAGHLLGQFTTKLPSLCSACNMEFAVGVVMWGCRACDFDACEQCRETGNDPQNGTNVCMQESPPNPEALTDQLIAGAGDDGPVHIELAPCVGNKVEQLDDTEYGTVAVERTALTPGWWWGLQEPSCFDEATCSTNCSTTCSTTCSTSCSTTCSTTCSTPCSAESQDDRGSTSAAVGIADLVSFMRSVATARYPARARLFDAVHAAAEEALGHHFERLALVGSTALRIDTPDSDVDAVVFTRTSNVTGAPPPPPTEILRKIADLVSARDSSLQMQFVDCTRVPVLTISAGGRQLSLDLTVDQPLGEWHVFWFQSQRAEPVLEPAPMHRVPRPSTEGWEHGLEAATLRCVKWWLQRRHIPVSKEGGYPTVVWTFMVVHVLRCTLPMGADSNDQCSEGGERTLLGAIAAFFDTLAEGGMMRSFLFSDTQHIDFQARSQVTDSADTGSMQMHPISMQPDTPEAVAAWGLEAEVVPRISPATQLLYEYELHRAQRLAGAALVTDEDPNMEFIANGIETNGAALRTLFADVGEAFNIFPAVTPDEPSGVLVFYNSSLLFGILQKVEVKIGWTATFLHRRDKRTRFAIQLCDVDLETAEVVPRRDAGAIRWFHPCDFVCMAPLHVYNEETDSNTAQGALRLDVEALHRLSTMLALLDNEYRCGFSSAAYSNGHGAELGCMPHPTHILG